MEDDCPGEDSKTLKAGVFDHEEDANRVCDRSHHAPRTTHRATGEVLADWVLAGEGRATVKHDGTSCLVEGGKLFKRFDAKKGRQLPAGFQPCEPQPDPVTGHWPGWVPVSAGDPADRWHVEAFSDDLGEVSYEDGTYELVGPKVQGNRYGLDRHVLWRHGREAADVGRTREAIAEWLASHEAEGLVFHHPDGRMAKVRRKDFGLKWWQGRGGCGCPFFVRRAGCLCAGFMERWRP